MREERQGVEKRKEERRRQENRGNKEERRREKKGEYERRAEEKRGHLKDNQIFQLHLFSILRLYCVAGRAPEKRREEKRGKRGEEKRAEERRREEKGGKKREEMKSHTHNLHYTVIFVNLRLYSLVGRAPAQ